MDFSCSCWNAASNDGILITVYEFGMSLQRCRFGADNADFLSLELLGEKMLRFGFVLMTVVAVLAGLGFKAASWSTVAPPIQEDYDQRLADMGHQLPEVSQPLAVYRRVVVVNNLAFLSGHIPISADGKILTGKVGDDVALEQAKAAAERTAIGMLASLKAELGTLNRVKRLVRTTGMVNCTSDFTDHSLVINGCSELFRDLFGEENGVGTRAAVGMVSLPRGAILEIQAIFELN